MSPHAEDTQRSTKQPQRSFAILRATVSVSDEGIGIPETDRARISDRLTRGVNVAGRISGSGVGLVIVRQVVDQHGGTVEVEGAQGQGSTFTSVLIAPAAATVEAG